MANTTIPPTKMRRYTRRSVRIADSIARLAITLGGLGTIAAVLGVCVFLAWVVWPLFVPSRSQPAEVTAAKWITAAPQRLSVDENGILGWTIQPDGTIQLFRTSDGHWLATRSPDQNQAVAAWSPASPGTDDIAFGLRDGTLRLGKIAFISALLPASQVDSLSAEKPSSSGELPDDRLLIEPAGENTVRTHGISIDLATRIDTGTKSAPRLIDYLRSPQEHLAAVVHADGMAQLIRFTSSAQAPKPSEVQRIPISYQHVRSDAPAFLFMSEALIGMAWTDGTLARFRVESAAVRLIEVLDLVQAKEGRLTSLCWAAGRETLLAGDSLGELNAWFVTMSDELGQLEKRARLTLAHQFPQHNEPISAIAASERGRVVAVGYAHGNARLVQITTGRQLLEMPIFANQPVSALALTSRQDAIFAATKNGLAMARLDLGHADVSLASLFLPVWYQDYETPAHVWQSSGGSTSSEPKLGVMPLVFGTIKATCYSLLFAVPIAILAAVYTSEFLARGARARIKPTIELMASLPSVVLGYLAAFVIAPAAARYVPAILVGIVTVPLSFLLVAYLLQILPERIGVYLKHYRFLLICCTLPIGLALAHRTGPLLERWLFNGNMIRWLDSNEGSAVGGWLLLFVPLCAVATGYLVAREITPRLRRASLGWSGAQCAWADLLKFLLASAMAFAAAMGIALALAGLGYDARGSFVGPYIQRNAMIVGCAMGFAIIPLIYTIAEDALASVPEHLRTASLGSGATPWQTTIRIIIPTATSGLFSAVMIGLGRAVGETMIVLMAAGNTPIMDWNIFNGFRTLSANLAVELPEAEQGSSHFRVLFLTALVLFIITFAVNTVAELVRQRFRRRAYQL